MAEREVRKLSAVMFTDIEGYTAFVQKDETAALQKVSTHRRYLEKYTKEFNGRIIEFYGDGSLSIYESALDAVHCGIEMQKAYRTDHPIPVRVGIHVGDIVFKEDTVFGDGVNIASRLQSSGIAGSILISDRVRAELANHPEIKTKSIGKRNLKNVSTPVEIFVVTNEGLAVPTGFTKLPSPKKFIRYIPLIILAGIAYWFINRPIGNNLFKDGFKAESISVPLFKNLTGETSLDHISQMASHWITKELSSTPEIQVVSYESASDMINMAGVSLSTDRGRAQYASLTGAVNIVEASFIKIGAKQDSLMMSGFIKNLNSGKIIESLKDVNCVSTNPLECIKAMAGNIKGYWVSRDDHVLTPPNYEAYKAYLAARKSWLSLNDEYVFKQLNKAIQLDPDFIDPYFLMLDFFYNNKMHQAAADSIQAIRKKFKDLDDREMNMLRYHTADVEGRNQDAYRHFLEEYKEDSMDLFTNNSAMVLALMYKNDPLQALRFFDDIPFDSIHLADCLYCYSRLEFALWAALDLDSMELADQLAPKIHTSLVARKTYGILISYYVSKKDTTNINMLITAASKHANLDRAWQYLPYLAGRLFLLRGENQLASAYAKKAIEAYTPIQTTMGRYLARSYYLDNQLETALTILRTEIKKEPENAGLVAEIGMVYARQENRTEALKMIDQLEKMRQPFEYGYTEYYQGRIYGLLGDKAKATELLHTAITKGQKYDQWITFRHDPDLMVLNDYPEYQKLMKEFK